MLGAKITLKQFQVIGCMVHTVLCTILGITTDTLSPTLKERGSLYLKNKDKDGWPLLVFAVRKHTKGIESPELMKQHFLYYMDRIDR